MIKVFISLLAFNAVFCEPYPPAKHFIYNSYNYDTKCTVIVNNETEQIMDFYENPDKNTTVYPTRVQVSTDNSVPLDYPIFITATQQKGVSAWELPMVVQEQNPSLMFNNMARTLCPHDAGPDIKSENRPTIHITTENPKNTSVDIKLRRVTDFYVEVNQVLNLTASPSTSKYYYFSFDQNPWNISEHYGYDRKGIPIFNYTIPKSVILIIESDDELCATVSIQNNSSDFTLDEKKIHGTCHADTMLDITINQLLRGEEGAHVVLYVFDNEKEILYQGYHLTMTSKGGITLTQSMFPRGFYVVFIVKQTDTECTGASETNHNDNTQRLKTFRFKIIATVSYKEYIIGALVLLTVVSLVAAFVCLVAIPFRYREYHEVLVHEEEPSNPLVEDQEVEVDQAWSTRVLTVGRLTQAPPDTLARRSDRYFWGALTLAIVYALPVVQLLFTYQQMVFATGNQDLCYYNFLCAHPLGMLSDFNHVYSNIGYVLLGAAFLIQVRARQRNRPEREDMGIPQHYGLLYSMGLGLCMEGFLSACYHLCPNKMNFQFDSSFMYVIAVLVMLKLYQNRHSDLIPSAHSTFMLIALIMSIGLFGILFPSVGFSVVFTLLHITTCLILTLRIYYAGSFQMEVGVFGRAWAACRSVGARAAVPTHRARAALLALANLANWTFAIYSAVEHNEDFARQLLAILMGNALLYTMFYICMKLIHKEKILLHTWVYLICAQVLWAAALQQFINGNTRWSETPALSRRRNAVCSMLGVLDRHDAWHAASAAAVYLSYNALLTVDDALLNTRRQDIHTF